MAQHGGGGRVVGGYVGLQPLEVEIGECPAREPAGGLGGDAVAPEAAADPVAEPPDAGACRIAAQPDDADQDFVLALAAGDGEADRRCRRRASAAWTAIQSSANSRG